MSKKEQKKPGIDFSEPRIGRTYKLWSERSDRDFGRWLRLQSYLSPLYRITYIILAIILLLIGFALLGTGSKNDGVGFIAVGLGILLLILLGNLIRV